MSAPPLETETGSPPAEGSQPTDLVHNPAYPVRNHFHESAELEAALQSAEERIRMAHQKLSALGNHANQSTLIRLFHQMLGARDQIAESRRRLPLETGGLYHEDRERFKQAIAALDRVWRLWEKAVA